MNTEEGKHGFNEVTLTVKINEVALNKSVG